MSGHGNAQGGNPTTLAALAAGACAALLALWAMRGLPLGGLLLWVTPLPLMLAGLAFGAATGVVAAAVSALAVLLMAPLAAFGIYLAVFAIPAALLLGAGLQAGRVAPGLPLAVLGLWPVAVLLVLALLVGDLEAAMREAVEAGVRRMGVALPDGMVAQVAQVKAGAVGFWLALVMTGNTLLARFLLRRWNWPVPGLSGAPRLPAWYLPLPALAFGAWLAAGGAVALSAFLMLLVPLFLLGVAAVHAKLEGRPARVAFLAGFYLLMLVFLQVMGPLMVGLGLYEQIRRRPAPPPT